MALLPATDEQPEGALIIRPQRGWLSPHEAAEYAGLGVSTIRTLINDGALPASQLVRHGRILIARSDLDALLEANRVEVLA